MAEGDERQVSVVMLPWLAHGHITPFLELTKGLASHGLQIFFVSTPLNMLRIKRHLLDSVVNIELVELAMPYVEGLPAGVESTADAAKRGESAVSLSLLAAAMDLLQEPFEALLRQLSSDVVIHDFVQHWAPRVAKPIPTILFVTIGMAAFSFAEAQLDISPENPTAQDMTSSPPGFPSPVIKRRLFEDSAATEWASVCVREIRAIVCNKCMELEGVYVEFMHSLRKRQVHPVGILMPKLRPVPSNDICLQWLDRQPAGSVVLLAFGSEYVLTQQQLAAIAMGLRESSVSFL